MVAEAFNSLADTTNQVSLLLGRRFYKRPSSEKHPFGYGKERFFWSFIAAIFIFGVGATYAVYEGIEKIRHPHEITNLVWAYWILGLSLVLEAGSIGIILAIAAFSFARSSRGLLLGEAAIPKDVELIRQTIKTHPNVNEDH